MSDQRTEIACIRAYYEQSTEVAAWLRRQQSWITVTRPDPQASEVRVIIVYAKPDQDAGREQLVLNHALRAAFPPPRPWIGWEDDEGQR